MATVVSKLIGPGASASGGYETPALWIAACPLDLVSADQIWQGQLMAGEHVFSGAVLTIPSSILTDVNCYVEFTAAPGATHVDHPNKATNPLRYDPTKSAAIRFTGASGWAITVASPYARVNKIHVLATGATSSAGGAITTTGSLIENVDINQCVLESAGRVSNAGTVSIRGSGTKIRNSLIIQRSTSTTTVIASLIYGASAYNCTCISIGATLLNGIATQYTGGTLKNIYVGGATNPHNGGSTMTITNCFSDVVGSASFFHAPLSTATFNNLADGTHDFRLPPGSVLIDNGIADAVTASFDIYGTSRPQNGSYDVGAWETVITDVTAPTLTSPTGASTGTTSASGTVSTNENTGTLYYLASINATETVATVKANGATQAVSSAGTKTVTVNGLTASTTYYMHYVHRDGSGNDSTSASSAAFTTSAAGDSTPPTLTAASIAATGSTTASGTISTNEANGALYRYVSTNATETAATVKAANLSQAVTTAGSQSVSIAGLAASVTYYAHFVHRDASGNDSAVLTSAAFTTQPAAGAGTLTIPFFNGAGQGLANLTNLIIKVVAVPSTATIATFTGESTDANNNCVVSSPDIQSGTKYGCIAMNSDGTIIGSQFLTATA